MAAELVTPIDEFSGLPLAVAPKCEAIPLNRPDIADDHHGWHPRSAPIFQSVAGIALRNSWIQYIERDLHNEGPFAYHRIMRGPELPEDETDIYGRVVLACAGYIPENVLDLTSQSVPFERPATKKERDFLHRRNRLDPYGYRYIRYGYDPVRQFLLDYALQQDLGHVKESTIDEFLHTPDVQKKLKIGEFLLWKASERATEGIKDKYKLLAKSRLLHPKMPHDPKPLVKWKLGSTERIETHVIPALEKVLQPS